MITNEMLDNALGRSDTFSIGNDWLDITIECESDRFYVAVDGLKPHFQTFAKAVTYALEKLAKHAITDNDYPADGWHSPTNTTYMK